MDVEVADHRALYQLRFTIHGFAVTKQRKTAPGMQACGAVFVVSIVNRSFVTSVVNEFILIGPAVQGTDLCADLL